MTREDLKHALAHTLTHTPGENCLDIQQKTICGKPEIPGPGNGKDGKKLTVLLAEDHPINRKLVERFLKLKGWKVLHAANGEEAIQKFRENPVDIVLMDIQMPEVDGYEAASKIRELEAGPNKGKGVPRVPIIALTAHALADYRDRSFSSGMDDYLTKPIDAEKLYALIRRLTGS
jgi:CheY-like chemotaxis protein